MPEKTNKVTLELKKTGLRVLNEKELQSVGGGSADTQKLEEPITDTETTDVTSVTTRN